MHSFLELEATECDFECLEPDPVDILLPAQARPEAVFFLAFVTFVPDASTFVLRKRPKLDRLAGSLKYHIL